jgi:hypothetical protein
MKELEKNLGDKGLNMGKRINNMEGELKTLIKNNYT